MEKSIGHARTCSEPRVCRIMFIRRMMAHVKTGQIIQRTKTNRKTHFTIL